MKDKNAGAQKFLVGKGDKARIVASTDDAHFTTLGFTALDGELVIIAVIIAKTGELRYMAWIWMPIGLEIRQILRPTLEKAKDTLEDRLACF